MTCMQVCWGAAAGASCSITCAAINQQSCERAGGEHIVPDTWIATTRIPVARQLTAQPGILGL